jgi:hypothetical protein
VTGQRVQLKGADRLAATLAGFGAAVADMTPEASAAAAMVAATAKGRAPKRSGRMAGSVAVAVSGNDATIAGTARYSGPIDAGVGPRPGRRGPHNIRPSRWLSGSLEACEPRVLTLYTDGVTRRLERVQGA